MKPKIKKNPKQRSRKIIKLTAFSALLLFGIFLLARQDAFWNILGTPLHKEIINHYSGEYKFDPLFIMSIVKAESNFQKRAKSSAGAIGLMQLLPSTASEMADELDIENFSEEMLNIPETNIKLGLHYLAKLRSIFGSNKIDMLAAYNAGLLRALEWRKGKDTLTIDDIEFPETRKFTREVLSNYAKLKKIQKIKKFIQKKND